jgi:hypothetical protein
MRTPRSIDFFALEQTSRGANLRWAHVWRIGAAAADMAIGFSSLLPVRLAVVVPVILISSAVATVLVEDGLVNSWTNVIVLCAGALVGGIWLARSRPTALQAWLGRNRVRPIDGGRRVFVPDLLHWPCLRVLADLGAPLVKAQWVNSWTLLLDRACTVATA